LKSAVYAAPALAGSFRQMKTQMLRADLRVETRLITSVQESGVLSLLPYLFHSLLSTG
jgi:hypothetical protein